MAEQANESKSDALRKLGQAATIAGVLVTTLGIAVTVWLSLRTETKKSASFAVLSSQPFVVSEPSSSSNFTILYKNPDTAYKSDTEIKNPWLLSLRLINTGNVIIEENDIEIPLEIKINNAHLVQATVRDDSFGAKPGNPVVEKDKITLEPFFLNPKGYLDYDLVTDGKPSIALGKGVIRLMTSPIEIEFSQEKVPTFVTVVPLSTSFEILALVFSTILALATLVIGIFGLVVESKSMFKRVSGHNARILEQKIDEIKLGDFDLFVADSHGTSRFAGTLSATTANDIDLLKTHIAKASDLAEDTNLGILAGLIDRQYRDKFRERLANTVYIAIPSPVDYRAKRRISEMDNRHLSLQEFLNRAQQITKEEILSMPKITLSDITSVALLGLSQADLGATGLRCGSARRISYLSPKIPWTQICSEDRLTNRSQPHSSRSST